MKRIVAIGICLLLLIPLGVATVVLPEVDYNFTIQLTKTEDGANVSAYFEGEYIGKTDKNGFFVYNTEELELHKRYNLTFKKEGFRDCNVIIYKCNQGGLDVGYSMWKIRPTPTPPTPRPEDYKTQAERITELENQTTEIENQTIAIENTTQEQETRLTALETLIQKITEFLKTLGFKE